MITDTSPRIVSVEGDIITIDFEPVGDVTPEQKLRYLIAAGKYDWVDHNITADRFPVEGTGTANFLAKLFHFNRFISSEDAVVAMESERFTPATHVHGLVYGAALPEEQRKYPIACLGSSAQVEDGRYVVCLSKDGGKRGLLLCGWGSGWYRSWRFLAVQYVSRA